MDLFSESVQIHVPQLAVHKCNECGQTLPENFEAPADEPWTTGIFGCTEDMSSCKFSFYFFLLYKETSSSDSCH